MGPAAATGVSRPVRAAELPRGAARLSRMLPAQFEKKGYREIQENLFSQQINTCNLKFEIKKLSQGSPEPIEPSFFTADYHLLHHSSREYSLSPNNSTDIPTCFDLEEAITYEQMQTVIEEVLEESGYYNFTSNRDHSYHWGTKNHPNNR
nr:serine/threonine-protein kinase Nek10-like [Vicugna pacos]